MTPASRFLPLLLLGLLSVTHLPTTASYPVTAEQSSAVQATLGEGAPHGAWQTRIDTNRVYLHGDPSIDQALAPVPVGAGKWLGTPRNASLDLNKPTATFESLPVPVVPVTQAATEASPDPDDRQFVIAGPGISDGLLGLVEDESTALAVATIPMAPTLDNVRVYSLNFELYAACDVPGLSLQSSIPAVFAIHTKVREEARNATGVWVLDKDLVDTTITGPAQVPGSIVRYSNGGHSFGDPIAGTGHLVEAGHRLVLELRMPRQPDSIPNAVVAPNVFCVVHYDTKSYASHLRLTDDGARLAMFPANRDGDLVTGFPAGDSASSSNRRIFVHAQQASPWADAVPALLDKDVNLRFVDVATNKYLHYVEENQFDFRTIPRLTRTDEGIGPSLVDRVFEFAYGDNLTEATIQPELYSFDEKWTLVGDTFRVGGKGIALTLLPAESSTHRVSPKEPTQFSLLLTNTGTQDDTVTVGAAEPGAGWLARIVGGGQYFVAPGKSALVIVEVTPPATATAGQSKTIQVRGTSSHQDVPDAPLLSLTTEVVSGLTRGLDLTSTVHALQIRPGTTKSFALTLANTGTARDDFLLLPSIPTDVRGWTVRMDPTSTNLVAGARQQVQAVVTAPPEAASGMSFNLSLRASEVGNLSLADAHNVTVSVFSIEGVAAQVLDPLTNRTLRGEGDPCHGDEINVALCTVEVQAGTGFLPGPIPDTDFDQTSLFRVIVENLGDQPDAFKVEAEWLRADGTRDTGQCETGHVVPVAGSAASSDGVPDGWRFNGPSTLGQPLPGGPQRGVGAVAGYSGFVTLNGTDRPFRVPALSSANYLVELGTVDPPCPGALEAQPGEFQIASAVGHLRLKFTSVIEPTRSTTTVLKGGFSNPGIYQGPNQYSGAIHGLGIQPALNAPTAKGAELGQPVVFDVVAYNAGNEYDDLLLRVDSSSAWNHRIAITGSVPPGIVTCHPPSSNGFSVYCPRVGVFDEVHFQVIATPGPDVRVGDRDHFTVSVQSVDNGRVLEYLALSAKALGTHDFGIRPLGVNNRAAVQGGSVSLPFLIENRGTANDRINISLIESDPTWRPKFSGATSIDVPAEHDYAGFLTVTPPANATGLTLFRIQAQSNGSGQLRLLDLFATGTPPSALSLAGDQGVLIPKRGVPTNVTVTASLASGPNTTVTFTPDQQSLPPGWIVTPTSVVGNLTTNATGSAVASATFQVTAPADALSDSRSLLRVTAVTSQAPALRASTDVALSVASIFGLRLSGENLQQTIAPGGSLLFETTLDNLALSTDSIALSHSTLPPGWGLLFDPPIVSLGPLESKPLLVKVTAPVTAKPGDFAGIVVTATSQGDAAQSVSLALQAQTGFNQVLVTAVEPVLYGAPQEILAFVVNITNNGTLPDQVVAVEALETTPLANQVAFRLPHASFDLDPGQTIQALLEVRLGDAIPAGSGVQLSLTATSILDERTPPASNKTSLMAKVLPYWIGDVNRDGLVEYAVDRNRDARDGYEEFRTNQIPGGSPLASPDLSRFLDDESRTAHSVDRALPNGTTVRTLVLVIDGDQDRRVDHFLDATFDGQPDFYLDPDDAKSSPIEWRRDINNDQAPELFIDTKGSGQFDAVYDLTRGAFTPLLHVDADGDGETDYVVDLNEDGIVDGEETVLYMRTGTLIVVQKVDVDGVGGPDQVFDVNDDGYPDYFIPAHTTRAVEIVLRDISHDGKEDWAFDSDQDGRIDTYYNPATGKTHLIDARTELHEAFEKYWYIGALFGLVLILFAFLLVVTRR